MANPQPKKNTRGRPKGVQNKMTIEIKEAIRQALEEVGGVSYLVQVAREHPPVFCALLGRMIPLEQHHTAKGLPTAITIVRAVNGNSSN